MPTVNVAKQPHRKCIEPSRAKSGHQISCCSFSLHILSGILAPVTGRSKTWSQVRYIKRTIPNGTKSAIGQIDATTGKQNDFVGLKKRDCFLDRSSYRTNGDSQRSYVRRNIWPFDSFSRSFFLLNHSDNLGDNQSIQLESINNVKYF